MRRWVFNLAAGVSMVMCAATILLWVRSYRRDEMLEWWAGPPSRSGLHLSSVNGNLFICNEFPENYRRGLRYDYERVDDLTWVEALRGLTKFQFSHHEIGPVSLLFPDWLIVLVAGFPAFLWILARHRQRRIALCGLCAKCGYDLRATPDRCPECGTEVVKRPTSPGISN